MSSATVDGPRAAAWGNGSAPHAHGSAAGPPPTLRAEPEQVPAVLSWPLRPPRRVAGIPVGLLVCWQAALLLALIAIGRPAGAVIALGTAAALVVIVTGLRPRGRWVHEWLVLWLRYTFRGQRVPDPRQPPALALLDLAATTEAVADAEIDDEVFAMISHAHGYATALELRTENLSPFLPLTLAPLHQPDAPVVSVQLIVHATPVVPATPMATVRSWLAVQVARDPGYQPEELRGALVNAVRRLQRRLRATQLEAKPVDRSRLAEALHTLTRLDHAGPPPGTGDNVAVGTERWRTWWTRGVPQESVAIRSWPGSPGPPAGALFEVLLSPRWPQTVSIASRRMRLPTAHGALQAGEEVVAVELVVRVSERDRSTLEAAVRQLRDRLRAAGAVIERLDGRQLPALAATMPTGGFLSGYAPSATAFPAPPRRRAARQLRAQPEYTAGTPAGRIPPPLQRDAVLPPPPLPPAPRPAPPTRPPSAPPAPPPSPQVRREPSPPIQPAPAGLVPPSASARVPAPPERAAPPATPPPAPSAPEPIEIRPLFPARGKAEVPPPPEVPATPEQQPPVRGQAAVPPPEPMQARGKAQVPEPDPRPTGAHRAESDDGYFAIHEPTTSDMPTALRGVAPPPPPPAPPPAPPHVPVPPQSPPPADVPGAVRAYGASLFTSESQRRRKVEQLMTLVRTPHRSAEVVAVISGASGLGASTTAAGMARILATVRDDYTALLSAATGRVDAATIQDVSRGHAFVVVDLGAHASAATQQALSVSTRVVVVTSADKHDATATRAILDRIHQVKPMLVSGAVIAVVCKTGRQYRRVLKELSADRTPQATQIIPIPADPAVRTMEDLDLTRLAQATREAYLRLAAAVATPRPAAAGGPAPTPAVPPR